MAAALRMPSYTWPAQLKPRVPTATATTRRPARHWFTHVEHRARGSALPGLGRTQVRPLSSVGPTCSARTGSQPQVLVLPLAGT